MYEHIACSSVHDLSDIGHGKHIVLNVLERIKVSCSVRKTGCWMRSASASESDS